jgi:hypothetical protein
MNKRLMLFEMTSFLGKFTRKRFGHNVSRASMNKKDYSGDMECSYLGGLLLACEEIFKKNKAGEFQTKDDVIAELHLVYVDHFNYFQENHGYKVVDRADINRAINLSEDGNGKTVYF